MTNNGWIYKICCELDEGKHVRAFPKMKPESGIFDMMLFSENYNESCGQLGAWSVYPRRFMGDWWITSFKVENGGYELKLNKEQFKLLKACYFKAVEAEREKYRKAVENAS